MNKRGGWALVFSISLLVIFVISSFVFFVTFEPDQDLVSKAIRASTNSSTSSLSSLSVEQIEKQFNESFVYYMLYNIKAYDLHNPPLSSNTPKIKIVIDKEVYSAVVQQKKIIVTKEEIPAVDIIITTNKKEAAKMIKNKAYIQDSFKAGLSSVQLIADRGTLFAKGYLNLYTELTGKGITGNIVGMYID